MITIMFANEYTESVKNMRTRTVRLDREGDFWTEDERENERKNEKNRALNIVN